MMSPNRRYLVVMGLLLLSAAQLCSAAVSDLTETSLREVARIARAISVVQPYLKDSDYIEYGLDIYRAARRYHVEPAVLIAIAQQETSFSNNLPEGAAGEIGICQIRKMWLKNPGFRTEFGRVSIRELHKPGKNFLFAAWILKGLKDSVTKHTLPYWSYYNAVRFENRFKYFIAVNRYISRLRKNENYFSERAVAGNLGPPRSVVVAPRKSAALLPYRSPVASASTATTTAESNLDSVRRSVTATGASPSALPSPTVSRWLSPKNVAMTPSPVKKDEPKWIPNAVANLEQEGERVARRPNSVEDLAVRRPDIKNDRDFNANLIRASNIIDVKDFMPRSGAMQD